MKRTVAMLGGAGAAGLLLWAAWPSPPVPVQPPPGPRRAPALVAGLDAPAPTVPGEEGEPTAEVHEEVHEALRALATECDLRPDLVCEGPTCVVVMAMPDMESPWGWVQVAARSPRFVASTAARDLGLGPDLLPCAHAIDGLSGGAAVVEQPDGREVWCTGTGPKVGALCDTVAGQRLGVTGFDAPDVRRLSFR
jgi:hypothetical protein